MSKMALVKNRTTRNTDIRQMFSNRQNKAQEKEQPWITKTGKDVRGINTSTKVIIIGITCQDFPNEWNLINYRPYNQKKTDIRIWGTVFDAEINKPSTPVLIRHKNFC